MNKNISQLLQQLAGIWKQLGLNQRISILLATLAVLGGLAGLAFWSSRAEFSLLYGKLDEGEAAKVIAALDEAKVPYQISRGGGAIMVPSDKVYQVRMQMAGKGIPAAKAWASRFSTRPISASPISSSAPITPAPSRANWPAPSASWTRGSPRG